MVEIIPRWDLYSRVAKLEESIFTKEDAKVMEARMTTRMDAQEARMTTRMDAQEARMTTRMDAQEAKMTARVDAQEARMTARMDAQEARMYLMFGVSTSLTAINTFGLIKKKE